MNTNDLIERVATEHGVSREHTKMRIPTKAATYSNPIAATIPT